MRDHPVPQRAEFGGRTAQVQRPRVARRLWIVGVVLLGFLLASAPMPARAASVLSNGSVSPGSGTTATAFSFSVDYNSSNPPRNAQSVWAEAGGVTVPLALVAGGNTHDGTWRASSSLPVGSWQVTFHATTSADPQPVPIDGPIVTVTLPPPTPTPAPTPPPTRGQRLDRRLRRRQLLRPARRRALHRRPREARRAHRCLGPQPTSPPGDDDDPTAAPSSSASPSGTGEVLSGTPGPKATPDENNAPAQSPEASDPADADDPAAPRIPLLAPFLIVGGAMSVAGAACSAVSGSSPAGARASRRMQRTPKIERHGSKKVTFDA